jgi:hypothetical protein
LYSGAVNTSSSSASSSASSAVISFVVLAIARSWSGLRENITVPSRPSTTIAASAVGTSGGACAPTGAASASEASEAARSVRLGELTRAA